MAQSIMLDKAKDFAVNIVNICKVCSFQLNSPDGELNLRCKLNVLADAKCASHAFGEFNLA